MRVGGRCRDAVGYHAEVFNFGSRSLKANLDLYNALNSGSVIATNNNYGAFWLQPTGASLVSVAPPASR